MYEFYQRLLDEKGLKNADVARATGIADMTLSDWKKGKSTPKADKLKQIADFLGTSTDYLICGKEPVFTMKSAEKDVAFSKVPDNIKDYALKLSELSPEKQEQIMSLIDMLDSKK